MRSVISIHLSALSIYLQLTLLLRSQNKDRFVKDYKEMKYTCQWTLANEKGEKGQGRTVEKILYNHYKDKGEESLAHSWIIELDDDDDKNVKSEIKSLFEGYEWQEICEEKPSALLMADVHLADSMVRFLEVSGRYSIVSHATYFYPIQLKSPADLRHILDTTFSRDMSQPYNSEEHYDSDWVTLVMRKMYIFICFPFSLRTWKPTYLLLDQTHVI